MGLGFAKSGPMFFRPDLPRSHRVFAATFLRAGGEPSDHRTIPFYL